MAIKKLQIKIKITKQRMFIFLAGKIFMYQYILPSNNELISNKLYTFFYITKILSRFGLIAPVNKNFGY